MNEQSPPLQNEDALLLAGDIGATKTVLALYSLRNGPHEPVAKATFPSTAFKSLEEILAEFLPDRTTAVSCACFGIAGPVVNGRVRTTNLPWVVEEQALGAWLGAPVRLLNDLAAIAHAVPFMSPDNLVTVLHGTPTAQAPLAVIAPGTGLGEAFLMWTGTEYRPFASEGGHADFAPNTALELGLLAYLQARHNHVSYELVCSGRGLPNLYDFLRDSGRYSEPEWLARELSDAEDRTPVIVRTALEEEVEISIATVRLFRDILAAEAGNMALRLLAGGGVYLGGGLPPRLLTFLQEDAFQQAFMRKGRFSDFLERVPVYVILNPEAALFGAAVHGLEYKYHRE